MPPQHQTNQRNKKRKWSDFPATAGTGAESQPLSAARKDAAVSSASVTHSASVGEQPQKPRPLRAESVAARTLFIGRLPADITRSVFETYYAPLGENIIDKMTVGKPGEGGYCLLTFKTQELAMAAAAMEAPYFHGRRLVVKSQFDEIVTKTEEMLINLRQKRRKLGEEAVRIVAQGLSLAPRDWSKEPTPVEAGQFRKDFSHLLRTDEYTEEQVLAYRNANQLRVFYKRSFSAPTSADGQDPKPRTNLFAPAMSFDDIDFPPSVTAHLRLTYERPLPIQAQAWPILLSGKDCIGLAKTGSGKTLAFVLPAIVHFQAQPKPTSVEGPVVLVLAPTRELVLQIADVFETLKGDESIRVQRIYGGNVGRANKSVQASFLALGSDVVVACPGRLIDLYEAGAVKLSRVTFLVVDEADQMLALGFAGQIVAIVSQLRPDRQTLFFSATWVTEVKALAGKLLVDPVKIVADQAEEIKCNPDIEQRFIIVSNDRERVRGLQKFLAWLKNEKPDCFRTLVFANTKDAVNRLVAAVLPDFPTVKALHGDVAQSKRESALEALRDMPDAILFATDVASRGLDIHDLACVINVHLPRSIHQYIHRIGRTGRAGRKGLAVTFFDPEKDFALAPDLVRCLRSANQAVPKDIMNLCEEDAEGVIRLVGSGPNEEGNPTSTKKKVKKGGKEVKGRGRKTREERAWKEMKTPAERRDGGGDSRSRSRPETGRTAFQSHGSAPAPAARQAYVRQEQAFASQPAQPKKTVFEEDD